MSRRSEIPQTIKLIYGGLSTAVGSLSSPHLIVRQRIIVVAVEPSVTMSRLGLSRHYGVSEGRGLKNGENIRQGSSPREHRLIWLSL